MKIVNAKFYTVFFWKLHISNCISSSKNIQVFKFPDASIFSQSDISLKVKYFFLVRGMVYWVDSWSFCQLENAFPSEGQPTIWVQLFKRETTKHTSYHHNLTVQNLNLCPVHVFIRVNTKKQGRISQPFQRLFLIHNHGSIPHFLLRRDPFNHFIHQSH